MRRDLLSLISYRTGFVSDWVGLAFQVFLLHFVGKLVDSQRLPTYAGQHVTYLEFAAVVLLAFAPVVWGLGLISAAGILTFRRGAGIVGIGATVLTLSAGAYFPLSLLPGWLVTVANLNPLAIALSSMRRAVLGNAGW